MLRRILLLIAFIVWSIVLVTIIIPIVLWIGWGINWVDDGVDYIDRNWGKDDE